jgi:hypothetical protein
MQPAAIPDCQPSAPGLRQLAAIRSPVGFVELPSEKEISNVEIGDAGQSSKNPKTPYPISRNATDIMIL